MSRPEPRRVLSRPTGELSRSELERLRRLVRAAFVPHDFADDDWRHALGGVHVIVEVEGEPVAHASVVPRTLTAGSRELSTGYVEAVATQPGHARRGHASAAMAEAGRVIRGGYELGALSTGVPEFYTRLGWEQWRGPTWVSTPSGPVRTAEEDGGVYVLRTPSSGRIDLDAPLMCDHRSGNVW